MMREGKCCGLGLVASILLIVGGLNWGLIGLGGFLQRDLNVVNMLLGQWPQVMWVVYILVGLAAIWAIFSCKACCAGWCNAGK